jgi:DNA topoisomerase-2
MYRKLDHAEHVLHRPDMYIGSIQETQKEEFVCTDTFNLQMETFAISEGLVRLFIEVLANAIDHISKSTTPVTCVKISADNHTISMTNDGDPIPVEKNADGEYYASMIFGQLLTSSNYDDSEERVVAGKNGIGVKAVSIFSKRFSVECGDSLRQKILSQTWCNNMQETSEPKIKSYKRKTNYTKVEWEADFGKFGTKGYSDHVLALFKRYAMEAAMLSGIKIFWNDTRIPVRNFKDYVSLYPNANEMVHVVDDNSEAILTPSSSGDFEQISFVNGIQTPEGGAHVSAYLSAFMSSLSKKFKKKVNSRELKNHFRLFVKARVINPVFSSQNKTKLSHPSIRVKEISTSTLTKILKWSIVSRIQTFISDKDKEILKTAETRRKRVVIEGYDPANYAGGKKSLECILILCEGLSAKTFAVKGIHYGWKERLGRNYWGIYPLRGKVLNVRSASTASISKNKEITDIIQILNLKYDVDYTLEQNFQTLNYGSVMILSDADEDGTHIASLIINFFETLFPTLLKREFLWNMTTPIVKITKPEQKLFYSQQIFLNYSQNLKNITMKYYKGLGGSTKEEVRDTFGKRVYAFERTPETPSVMDMVFNQKKSDLRKEWIQRYTPSTDTEEKHLLQMPIPMYINHELIQFSISDCARSIPNICDGFKISQRKVFYTCIKENLTFKSKVLKVAQLGGLVAKTTNYHHGEQNLFDTIIRMGQEFINSNNYPLLLAEGNFGTRLENGNDSASPRYIFTKLNRKTRIIFHPDDDTLLSYKKEDGSTVEPRYYLPVIPMVLVNGVVAGIGTGFSCQIPSYNPTDICTWIKAWIQCIPPPKLKPWYNGFTGRIEQRNETSFETFGIYNETSHVITEIPVGKSISQFRAYLEKCIESKGISDYEDQSSDEKVWFRLKGVKKFSMPTTILHTSNMVLFTEEGTLKKFEKVEDILEYFCVLRMNLYAERKKYLLSNIKQELFLATSKLQFLNAVCNGDLDIWKLSEKQVEAVLHARFKTFEGNYNYLLNLSMRSFTKENITKLEKIIHELERNYTQLQSKTIKSMWLQNLEQFEL